MSKGNTFENDILGLILRGSAIANIADNAAAAALTVLYVSLHTLDPGETGDQTTNEVSATGYARASIARTTGGWGAPANGSCSPAAAITFGALSSGASSAGFFAIGTAASGAGKILYKGSVTPPIPIQNGVTPSLSTATTITED
jgi:hypothetical protein